MRGVNFEFIDSLKNNGTKYLLILDDSRENDFCVTPLRYNVGKPQIFYAQVRLFARKKEDDKFQQVVYVNYKLEEFI